MWSYIWGMDFNIDNTRNNLLFIVYYKILEKPPTTSTAHARVGSTDKHQSYMGHTL